MKKVLKPKRNKVFYLENRHLCHIIVICFDFNAVLLIWGPLQTAKNKTIQ